MMPTARPKQNWILGCWSDMILVIAAPLWAILLVGWAYHEFGFPVVAAAIGIYSIAHHFPTFLRIYGDRDLLRRFRWSILLGPLVPFLSVMAIVTYVVLNNLSITRVSYVLVFVVVWAPWHLMMQHYGFMRIYDRHNQAPRHIQTRMDWTLCLAWFAYILSATLHWLPDLLYMMHVNGLRILSLIDRGLIQFMEVSTWILATGMTVAYAFYIGWCFYRGFFVSYAKLLLVAMTFGGLYLTCVPNAILNRFSPDWNFALGLLTLSVIHNSQYFAIVWRFNRGLAKHEDRSRAGWFRKSFARGGLLVIAVYVVVSVVYGSLLGDLGRRWFMQTSIPGIDSRWIVGTILALAFTSELMHYYYDGFVWKVRHKETRVLLDEKRESTAEPAEDKARAAAGHSWWSDGGTLTPLRALLRHTVYFGVIILVLTVIYWSVSYPKQKAPIQLALKAIREKTPDAHQEAMAAIQSQIEIETRMLELRKRAIHYAYLADLWYVRSAIERGSNADPAAYQRSLQQAISSIESAMALPPPFTHVEAMVISPVIQMRLDNKRTPSRQLSRVDYQRWRAQLRSELANALRQTGS